jgi:hypothetical protein
MFQGILTLVCKYQDQERIIKLRNKFVSMNPREWADRYNATVQVGLGTGSQDQRLEVLSRVLAVQEKLISAGGMGIVDPQKIYNTLEKYLENAGYKDASQFFNNPATMPPMPQGNKPNPAVQLAQADLQRQQAKDKAELQIKAKKLELDQQKLASQLIKEDDAKESQKEKLATQILQQGLRRNGNA